MKINKLEPKFLKYFPTELEDGILYISLEYKTATHKCCCGCGIDTVTPFGHPSGWVYSENDGKVSLSPSIGNFQIPCKSHYFIVDNEVRWC